MGSGIAQAVAQSGIHTLLYDLNPEVLANAKTGIQKNLQALATKGKISEEESAQIFKRIRFTGEVQDCLADLFIEAVVENPAIKVALFNQLAEINHSECIFASNTSSLSITSIARLVQHPERLIGLHFFNPATIMKLVEIVLTEFTNASTKKIVTGLTQLLGKTAVICKDSPGFIVNRVARPYYIESLRLVEEKIIDIASLDELMEATGFRMGPFRLMDLIGNDINYAVSCSVYEQLQQPLRLKPSFLQEEKVKEGKLGKKTGEGYYEYR